LDSEPAQLCFIQLTDQSAILAWIPLRPSRT